MKAVVLLSGGLDSTTTLAQAIADGCEPTVLSFRYGQRHTKELVSAENVCRYYGIPHVVIDIDLSSFRSALTRPDIDVPMDREGELDKDIPITYVPARNIVFLSIAAGLCESIDADRIYIGANAVDYSGYPDCRPEFFEAYEDMIGKGTKAGVEGHPIRIMTPIMHDSKADIVRRGKRLNAPLHLTWSCYNGGEKACGHCDSCRLRLKGFAEAGYKDEIEYEDMRDLQVHTGRRPDDGDTDDLRQDRRLQSPVLMVRYAVFHVRRDRDVSGRYHGCCGRLQARLRDRRGADDPAGNARAPAQDGVGWHADRPGDQRGHRSFPGPGRSARSDKHGHQVPLVRDVR